MQLEMRTFLRNLFAVSILGKVLSNFDNSYSVYGGVFKSFRTGRLERELQMVQLSATRCSCIAIL
jgi:hypothetical protein